MEGGQKSGEKSKHIHVLPKMAIFNYKIVSTHLIDGIYQGFVNSSYQRDGFGFLQTDQFQSYLGGFKYNRPQGLGLIIYTDGSIIYGHFNGGELEGVTLCDNAHQMQIGTFYQGEMVAIGFEYNYKNRTWRMNRYHKGVTIETITEEKIDMTDGVPKMLSLEAEILAHFMRFKNHNYFPVDITPQHLKPQSQTTIQDPNNFYFHEINDNYHFYGAIVDFEFEGLGVTLDPSSKRVLQVGSYRHGKLQGYGLKVAAKSGQEEMGLWQQGRKQGIFTIKQGTKVKYMEFNRDVIVADDKRGQTTESFKKLQKIYHYRQKDFLSVRHQLHIYSFQSVFETSEYKAWKLQEQADKKDKQENNKNESKAKKATPTNKMTGLSNMQNFEKSSIQIMKEKIFNMTNTHKKDQSKKAVNLSILKSDENTLDKKDFQHDSEQDEIALEEGPLDNSNMTQRRKKAVSFHTYNRNSQQ